MINKDYFISRQWSLGFVGKPGEKPLSFDRWVEFIDARRTTFTWHENTDLGESRLKSPDAHQLQALFNKHLAEGEFDKIKGYNKVELMLHTGGHKISVGFDGMRPNKKWLMLCLELAEYLGANLFTIARKKPMTRAKLDELFP